MKLAESSNSRCDILNLEWSSSGRDREVATLICRALRQQGYSVVEENIFNYKYYLLKYRPRLLYAADPKGARINYEAVKFAYKLGIPIVTVTAEGDYLPEKVESMFWGHITEKRLLENLNLQWSSRTRSMVLNLDPTLAAQVKVSGAIGFDRYRIYHFFGQQAWMQKYNLRGYKGMIGFAGWGFDQFYRDDYIPILEMIHGKEQLEIFRQQRIELNQILDELIKRNPDILFLLKEHPGVIMPDKSEFYGLEEHPNVLSIKTEEAIADCIAGCDIWMAFESTTCLEAWLLETPTLLVNPLGKGFARSSIHKGSPILRDVKSIQNAIDEFYELGTITAFDEKREARRQIVTHIIQWEDGKNHLRAAQLFQQVLHESPEQTTRFSLLDTLAAHFGNILFNLSPFFSRLPKLRTYAKARKRFQRGQLTALLQRYEADQRIFDAENPLTKQDILEMERVNQAS